jgi:6-phosphogluconate dehydrogenase
MELGMVGLGRMGANMSRRLLRGGHSVVAYDRNPAAAEPLVAEGAVAAGSLTELLLKLAPPRHVWLMVPSGDPVTETIEALVPHMAAGDTIIDGGNSYYRDTLVRADWLKTKHIHYIDCGTSGGIWGLENGYCLMAGGEVEAIDQMRPLFDTLAPENGFLHAGPPGAGHFTKMVHNGIEYGLMQAYAEGFELLAASDYDLDLRAIADLWNHGSVVRSWLLELAERALADDPRLETIKGYVEDSGEGRWTVFEAIERDVPATTLAHALFARFRSRKEDAFSDRMLAALREQFGGHRVVRE